MGKITSFTELEKLTEGDTHSLRELLQVFLKEGNFQIENLQTNFENGNLDELKNTAHKIKSSLMLIGLSDHRNTAEEIELSAEKDSQKTKRQVQELVAVYKRAMEEIKIKLQELP